jgi:hypothetical protein
MLAMMQGSKSLIHVHNLLHVKTEESGGKGRIVDLFVKVCLQRLWCRQLVGLEKKVVNAYGDTLFLS